MRAGRGVGHGLRSAAPTLKVPLSLKPMEAEPVDALPRGKGWLFEPKYDGFRCLAFRDGERVHLQSRNQKPLGRYFPELVQAMLDVPASRLVLDGEIVVPEQSFETLQLRLHPAASRIEKLAAETPARLIAFDLLADSDGESLLERPFRERRAALEALVGGAAAALARRQAAARLHHGPDPLSTA